MRWDTAVAIRLASLLGLGRLADGVLADKHGS